MKRNEDAEILFDLQDEGELTEALKSLITETAVGRQYRDECYTDESEGEDTTLLLSAVEILFQNDDGHATINQLAAALNNLLLSGAIQPKDKAEDAPLESPQVDLTPRDRNGKALTEQQLAWSEMTRFANESSMDAIRQRKNIDPKFRTFMATNLRREMQEQPVGDAVENLNPNRQAQQSGVPSDVRAYATKYRTMSAADVKKEMSDGLNPLGPAAAREARRLFEAACADGLL